MKQEYRLVGMLGAAAVDWTVQGENPEDARDEMLATVNREYCCQFEDWDDLASNMRGFTFGLAANWPYRTPPPQPAPADQPPPVYTSDQSLPFAVRYNDRPIAFVRGDNLDAPKIAAGIALAMNTFNPDVIRMMRTQLGLARVAMEQAREALTVAAETHPDNGTGGILLPGPQPEPEDEGIAGQCEAAAREIVEGLHFLDQVLLGLPIIIPFKTAADAAALAAFREAARPLKMAIVIEDGVIQRIVTTKPAEALVIDHDVEGADLDRLFRYEDDVKLGPDQTVRRKLTAMVHSFDCDLEPARVHEFQRALDDLTQPTTEAKGEGN
jgi:hypothetical protein